MTLMVRDEAHIISAMVEHHFDQGIDSMIVTDNGSVDGTTELLRALAKTHPIELRFDPVHRKQQHDVVTEMARAAFTTHSADWVINADADEFFIPMDRSMTLRGVFERLPKSLVSFNALVTNLVGPPARSGTGLQRLVYRDERSDSTLQEHGIVARPTPNAIHIGDPNVTVAQGNHFVNLARAGSPVPALAVEVLHLPWRSWEQFAHKVEIAGLAYESNPDLSPSPNHHGMLDYGRFKSGMLMPYYLLRHPTEEALSAGPAHGESPRSAGGSWNSRVRTWLLKKNSIATRNGG